MSSNILKETTPEHQATAVSPRQALAARIVLIGLTLGLLGDLLFYQKAIGLSFPLFILAVVLVTLAAGRQARSGLNWRNLWPLLPMLLIAAMVAGRANNSLTVLNVLATLGLGALTLHYLPLKKPLDEDHLMQHLGGAAEAFILTPFEPFAELSDSWAWFSQRNWRSQTLSAVLRGLVLAVPILIVFTLLLAAADEVFANYVQQAWDLIAFNPDVGFINQVLLTLMLGWIAMGALAYGIARRMPSRQKTVTVPAQEDPEAWFTADSDAPPVPMESTESRPAKRKRSGFRLGIIEAGMVLGLVDVLFAAFVVVQFAYFFGGQDTVARTGMGYAQYARRGFFELVAVSVLTLGMALWLQFVTRRQPGRENRLFIGLSIMLVLLTTVMLVSASQRMYLYEEIYGFTHLRVLTHVFMVWLAVLFCFFVLSLFEVKRNIFALGVLLTAICYLLSINLLNPDLYIAQRNLERYANGQALDVYFLNRLSADAVPALLDFYAQETNPVARAWAGQWLTMQLRLLDNWRAKNPTVYSFNLAREQAWIALDALRADLPAPDSAVLYPSARNSVDIYAVTPTPR